MKHPPTGKNKKQFEKWLTENNVLPPAHFNSKELMLFKFRDYPFYMQYGVLLEYYDSFDIKINTQSYIHQVGFWCSIGRWHSGEDHDSRQEAQIEALEKANELINQNLNTLNAPTKKE